MSDDSLMVEEVGPGAYAIRRGTRVVAVEDPPSWEEPAKAMPSWVQQELPLEEPYGVERLRRALNGEEPYSGELDCFGDGLVSPPYFEDEEPTTESDPVNQPSHYLVGGIETLDFIEAKELDFHLANVVKYVSRAGRKDPEKLLEDLKKAQFYLDRKIALLEGK